MNTESDYEPPILGREFLADPYPVYASFRKKGNGPREVVLESGMAYLPPGLRAWIVTSHADATSVLHDARFRKDFDNAMALFTGKSRDSAPEGETPPTRSELLYNNMANNDPPKHTRLRKPLNAVFSRRAVAPLAASIRHTADEILDEVAGARTFDLVQEFALPFSVAVICHILGVAHDDRKDFHHWASSITGEASTELLQRNSALMTGFLRELLRAKKNHGSDDVLTHLSTSLDEDEAVAQAYALLVAGYESTANLIVNGFMALDAHPSQRERLWANPDLVPQAVEEMLRHQSPFNLSLYRYASETAVVNGATIPEGSIVFVSFAAANRDDCRFAAPEDFNIENSAREHLAFGGGIHNCIGKHLARLEAVVAFQTLIQRCPELRVLASPERHAWKASLTFRGLRELSVGPGPARAAVQTDEAGRL